MSDIRNSCQTSNRLREVGVRVQTLKTRVRNGKILSLLVISKLESRYLLMKVLGELAQVCGRAFHLFCA